jgi:hypothetical protein
VYARPSSEGVDNEARVVANRGQSGFAGRVPRFDDRVCNKGVACFICATDSEIRLRHNRYVLTFQHAPDLAELASVTAGHDDFVRQLGQ